jgi:CxxH/CxxC protein (TIGR04129 family)
MNYDNYEIKVGQMDEDEIIYACVEHIEIAIDDYVNSEERAPQMEIVAKDYNKKCTYCSDQAKYVLLP